MGCHGRGGEDIEANQSRIIRVTPILRFCGGGWGCEPSGGSDRRAVVDVSPMQSLLHPNG